MDSSRTQQPIAIGQSDFNEFRKANAYYVDKSVLIRDIIECSAQAILLPRPRRFGKTLNLSMLRYFFEKYEHNRRDLFDGLLICGEAVFDAHQGRYPVIYMTFKDVKETGWNDCFKNIQQVVYKEYARHRYLLESDALYPEEKSYIQKILEGQAEKTEYGYSLEKLSAYLSRYHDSHVVILIDEYDTPIHAGYAGGYYEEIISFMRNFLSGGLKDNAHLFKGVLTGILRVAKESIFSGLNNLGVYTLLTKEFNTAFGFTESEIQRLLEDYELADRYDEVAYWYNGYLFGGEVIYNPWSVLNYVASQDKQPRSYWVNTGSTEILERLVTRNGRELRQELGQLLEGQTITRTIYDNIVMRDIDTHENLMWSFLLFSGYLKTTEQLNEERYTLQIPNREVELIYRTFIRTWFEKKIDLAQLEDMLHALQQGDVRLFEHTLRRVVLEVMSYHDLGGEAEKVYQALVLGMLVWLSDAYLIRSNRESGYGRYDMIFIPKDLSHQGIIIEFKRVYENEVPETVLERALQQIQDKQYITEMHTAGVDNILQLAVAFRGKEIWVKKESVL